MLQSCGRKIVHCRAKLSSSPDVAPRFLSQILLLSDELDLHEEVARDLLLATADASSPGLPEDHHWFKSIEASIPAAAGFNTAATSGGGTRQFLSHEARARRLFLWRRHEAISAVEDILIARLDSSNNNSADAGQAPEMRQLLLQLADEHLVSRTIAGERERVAHGRLESLCVT